RGQNMLQVSFRLTDGPASPSATTPHRLFMRPLDSGPRRVLLAELLGLRPPSSCLQRLVLLARQQPDDSGLRLRSGALPPEWAWRAILPREPRLEGHSTRRVRIGQPGDARLAVRAGHDLLFPVHCEASLVEAFAGTGLPARVLSHWADDGHPVLALA